MLPSTVVGKAGRVTLLTPGWKNHLSNRFSKPPRYTLDNADMPVGILSTDHPTLAKIVPPATICERRETPRSFLRGKLNNIEKLFATLTRKLASPKEVG